MQKAMPRVTRGVCWFPVAELAFFPFLPTAQPYSSSQHTRTQQILSGVGPGPCALTWNAQFGEPVEIAPVWWVDQGVCEERENGGEWHGCIALDPGSPAQLSVSRCRASRLITLPLPPLSWCLWVAPVRNPSRALWCELAQTERLHGPSHPHDTRCVTLDPFVALFPPPIWPLQLAKIARTTQPVWKGPFCPGKNPCVISTHSGLCLWRFVALSPFVSVFLRTL